MLELGQKSEYDPHYNPDKLFPIPRQLKRDEIQVPQPLPFFGFDLWNHYEVSWLNAKGKPMVAMAVICYDAASPFLIESKSMKLYFNSLNNTRYPDLATLTSQIEQDLSARVGGNVQVTLTPLSAIKNETIHAALPGTCLDSLDIECHEFIVNSQFLTTNNKQVKETLCSNLLKSNCLVTFQPDWGSIQITYEGNQINHEGLLRYLISFRNHNEFHEQCIERIFMDIMRQCQPLSLTVYGRYTRRGGLDINPCRSTHAITPKDMNIRLCRQ